MRAVIWSEDALNEFVEAMAYIAQDNPYAASRLTDVIETAGDALGAFPTGRQGRVDGTYEKVVSGTPYILAYALDKQANGVEAVVILRVIHAARDWPDEAWPE